ncbi:MAG: nicotinamidase [Candidatus Hydrogenedentes bacterium]|nr:nicotinamidase [Candidatus Hydrogenedentota bacterium]
MDIKPTDALIVVDVQNDFCPGGALPVVDGDAVVPVINRLLARTRHPVFTRDWHPANHCSFSDAPEFVDGSWPAHCVQNTPGAAFHPGLDVPEDARVVDKATDPSYEDYDGFQGTTLGDELRERGVDRVFICGLATDYCVKNTVLGARREGFEVVVVEDGCRAIDVPPGTAAQALAEMRRAGATVCESGDIL